MEETRLTPSEQRLVAAVKAGDELDLSRCLEQERMLRASFIYNILQDRAVVKPGAGVRLRGAIIEGDLDLSQVKTTMTVDLTNCEVTRICLGGASLPRFSVHTDAGRSRWFRKARALRGAIGKEPAFITALLFSFVVIKVIWIARGDIPTALGVFGSASIATIIVGGLLSVFPLISAVVLGFATFELSRGWPFTHTFLRDDSVVVIGLAAAAAASFFLTPWPIMVSGAVLGFASGVASRARKPIKRVVYAFLGAASIILILNPLLYAVWLPHEILTFAKPGQQPIVGYVLSDSNGWISLLRSGERRIYRFRSQDVTARRLCRARSFSMPFAPPWFNNPSALWTVFSPGESKALPPCP